MSDELSPEAQPATESTATAGVGRMPPTDDPKPGVTVRIPRKVLVVLVAVILLSGTALAGYFVGLNRGEDRGRAQGRAAGKTAGYADGYEDGSRDGGARGDLLAARHWASGYDCARSVSNDYWFDLTLNKAVELSDKVLVDCRLTMPDDSDLRERIEATWRDLEKRP